MLVSCAMLNPLLGTWSLSFLTCKIDKLLVSNSKFLRITLTQCIYNKLLSKLLAQSAQNLLAKIGRKALLCSAKISLSVFSMSLNLIDWVSLTLEKGNTIDILKLDQELASIFIPQF